MFGLELTVTRSKTWVATAVVIAGVGLLSACGSTAANSTQVVSQPGSSSSSSPTSYLYAMYADKGALQPVAGTQDSFTMTLTGADHMIYFTDRPDRDSGTISPANFASAWATNGFITDPPNVALTIPDAPGVADTLVATMTNPEVDTKKRTFSATLKTLTNDQIEELKASGSQLAAHAGRADPTLPSTFAPAALFIDNASVRTGSGTATPRGGAGGLGGLIDGQGGNGGAAGPG